MTARPIRGAESADERALVRDAAQQAVVIAFCQTTGRVLAYARTGLVGESESVAAARHWLRLPAREVSQ